MRILLLTPPMTQVNTPYPATAYLKGFLQQHEARLSLVVDQADPALELFLRLFSKQGLAWVIDELEQRAADAGLRDMPDSVAHVLRYSERIKSVIDPTIHFLQGHDPSLALRICRRDFLPEGARFDSIPSASNQKGKSLEWAFGSLGTTDQAKHLASLFIDDLGDALRDGIDDRYEISRYAESLAASQPSFDALQDALNGPPTLIDEILDELSSELAGDYRPDLLCISAPFPGNVYGGLRMAKTFKQTLPGVRVALGGGYVNTELRKLSEPRLFDYVDYVTLDSGEAPLVTLIEHLQSSSAELGAGADRSSAAPAQSTSASPTLMRTFIRDQGVVVYKNDISKKDVPFSEVGAPSYEGLPLADYVSLFEMLNPMHRLWSMERWNKLTIAHGCYWKQCTFCDVTLDYIKRYEPLSADGLVDRIESVMEETGERGFHFVDEAAPPARLRALAEKLIERDVTITWWGNVRFEKAFSPELAELMAASGCVALSGGLEVASDRLLARMKKGITVEQVAEVTYGLTQAGIMVHAYLMYGFPTQTEQETIDSLERVRQLFAAGCIESAFWHRFAATVHSPIGQNPTDYGIQLSRRSKIQFARNDIAFQDPVGTDHTHLGIGLNRALYNYMLGAGFDVDIRDWFDKREGKQVSPHGVALNLIDQAIRRAGLGN